MPETRKRLTEISEEEVNILKRKTAQVLPDSPVRSGMRAEAVKPYFYRAMIDADGSLVAFLKRVIEEANEALGLIDEALGDDSKALANHKEDLNAHRGLFDAVATVATNAARDISTHKTDTSAHRALLDAKADATKAALIGILGYATVAQDGVMTSAQANDLATLVNLLRNDDADTTINTIKEVLDAFAGSPEGTYVANEFSNIKRSINDLKAVGLIVKDGMLCQIYNV